MTTQAPYALRLTPNDTALLATINYLRSGEGDTVSLLCENPDFNGQPNNAVECNGGWTEWLDKRFTGDSLFAALNAAAIAKAAATQTPAPSPIAASPAVQPAAGREDLAWLTDLLHDQMDQSASERSEDGPNEHDARILRILAAISTPAQASGEPVAWNFNLSEAPEGESVILATEGGHVGEAMTPVRADEDDGWFWVGAGFVHQNTPPLAWRPLPAHPDALSAPQAAPGEGEQS